MFRFNLTGKVLGLNTSKDLKYLFVNLHADPVDNTDLYEGDKVGPISVRLPASKVPAGLGINNRVTVSGYGYVGLRNWVNRSTGEQKEIENHRYHASDIKLVG